MRRSWAAALYAQILCMQVGGVLYALAKLADSWEMVIVARVVGGLGCNTTPVLTYLAEASSKKQSSAVIGMVVGAPRSLGYALGPVVAAALVFVDFHVGKLTVDKETNAGWTTALLGVAQTGAILWLFPRSGSKLMKRDEDGPSASPEVPLRELVMHRLMLGFILWGENKTMACVQECVRACMHGACGICWLSHD